MKILICALFLVILISGCTEPGISFNKYKNRQTTTSSILPSTFPQTTSTIVLQPPEGVVLPIDLTDCQYDYDCVKVDQYLLTGAICNTAAINVKYKIWYNNEVKNLDPYNGGGINCSPLPPQTAVCIKNKCELKTTTGYLG